MALNDNTQQICVSEETDYDSDEQKQFNTKQLKRKRDVINDADDDEDLLNPKKKPRFDDRHDSKKPIIVINIDNMKHDWGVMDEHHTMFNTTIDKLSPDNDRYEKVFNGGSTEQALFSLLSQTHEDKLHHIDPLEKKNISNFLDIREQKIKKRYREIAWVPKKSLRELLYEKGIFLFKGGK